MERTIEPGDLGPSTLRGGFKNVLQTGGGRLVLFAVLLALPAALILGFRCTAYAQVLFAQLPQTDFQNEESVWLLVSSLSESWGGTVQQLLLSVLFDLLLGVIFSVMTLLACEAFQGGRKLAQNSSKLVLLVMKKLLGVMLLFYVFEWLAGMLIAPVSLGSLLMMGGNGVAAWGASILLAVGTVLLAAILLSYFSVMCGCTLLSRVRFLAMPFFAHYLLKCRFWKSTLQSAAVLFAIAAAAGLAVFPAKAAEAGHPSALLFWILWAFLFLCVFAAAAVFLAVRFSVLERLGLVRLSREGRVIFMEQGQKPEDPDDSFRE